MIKTRFAPSPTGFLHLGGARTALYSWLYAKKNNGKFVLRIEDTDRERSTSEAVDAILDGMRWLGLDWDEGPFYQTDRFDKYNKIIDELIEQGMAYRCYAPKDLLDTIREEQQQKGEKPRYNPKDPRVISANENKDVDQPHVVRYKNPSSGYVEFDDVVRGKIKVANDELDDLIIRRTDGNPTYNFTVVVDDIDMNITHVIRGEDHINNTPRQINIYHSLNANPPVFAHCSMILGDDGAKLSKRHGAVSVLQYKENGFLPEALINYLVRLGWSHGDQEIFSIDELIELFDLKGINKSASAFNTTKLLWLNNHYIKTLPLNRIKTELLGLVQDNDFIIVDDLKLDKILSKVRDRANTLLELKGHIRYFYESISQYDEKAAKKHLRPVAKEYLEVFSQKLKELKSDSWNEESIQEVIDSTCNDLGIGMGKLGMPLRVSLTGQGQSPSVSFIMECLGKEESLERISNGLNFIKCRS